MKKQMIVLTVLALLAAPTMAMAEHDHGKDYAEKKTAKLKEKLALSDEQAKQVRGILDAKGEKMKALMEDTQTQINGVLTPEQKEKYEALKKEMKEHRKDKKGGECCLKDKKDTDEKKSE